MMHKSSWGATYGSFWFALIHRRYGTTDVIIIKSNIGWVIVSFLDSGIGGAKANTIEGPWVTENKRV